jgi:enamine deaminase RidA (YjgF/YER057c/UK114 family)
MRFVLCLALLAAAPASAGEITRTQVGDFPISSVVTVPAGADMFYLSGAVPPVIDRDKAGTAAAYGDTKTQTVNVLRRIDETLKAHKLTLADIVSMRVYLVGDPAKDNKMDFAGMMDGYTQFFGTKDQPNKPSRTTVQVAALAQPGMLVEIEVTAARAAR